MAASDGRLRVPLFTHYLRANHISILPERIRAYHINDAAEGTMEVS
jgi:hypothetical protein